MAKKEGEDMIIFLQKSQKSYVTIGKERYYIIFNNKF